MRRTPPLVVWQQPQPAVQAVVVIISLLALGGLAAWAVSHEARAWPVGWMALAGAVWSWHASAALPHRLRWDGEAWWLLRAGQDAEVRVNLAVLIDLDAWLLLRASPGPCWLALSRPQQAHWPSLRATLFAAPARTEAPAADPP